MAQQRGTLVMMTVKDCSSRLVPANSRHFACRRNFIPTFSAPLVADLTCIGR
jgi:hypothetical protein